MSRSHIIARCQTCEHRCVDVSKDKNNPLPECSEKAEFPISLEWLNRDEILAKLQQKGCDWCGSKNWYLTDKFEN